MTQTEAWFDRLYGQHHRHVLAYCARRTAPADADDAAAEVFAVAWRRRGDIPGGDRELPWLYGVARNILSHQRRSSQRLRRLTSRVATVQEPLPPTPDAVLVQREECTQVREAVGRLRTSDREVLLLSAWEGLSHGQIAEALGLSRAAVDKRVTRAKQRLAKEYETQTRFKMHRPPASTAGGGGSR
jgi:RNA polymerase sigma-70 factor (ECF subfamily)